jgi:hypothetical protein
MGGVPVIEEVFEDLLQTLDEQGRDEMDDDWEDAVARRLEDLREAYDGLTVGGRSAIDYSHLATQAAYVFVYAIGRAEFTYQLLKRHRAAWGKPLFPNSEARITSLGGGPGSEIAGVVKYLLDKSNGENVTSVKYWVFDKDGDWENACTSLVESLNKFIPLELVFSKLDLCDQVKCGEISLEGDDLLILSFIISELCAIPDKDKAEESLRELYKTMDNRAKIFYNDSNASSFYYYFNDTRRFVKGLGRVSQVSEIVDRIGITLDFGTTYEDYMDVSGVTPHLNSDALSKLLVRMM